MADVPSARTIIQTEEVAYRAAVSEASSTRMAATVNKISKDQYDGLNAQVNGPYRSGAIAIDGAYICTVSDMEIVAYDMFNIVAGTGGTTEFDVVYITASGGSPVSIFSTKPAIAYTAGDKAYLSERIDDDAEVLENPAGTTLAVFSTTVFPKGSLFYINMTQAQTGGAQNCGFTLEVRPV